MSEKASGKNNMSTVELASEIIKSRIAPVGICQSVAERIRHASRKLGWSYSRTRDVWYANARTVHYHEMKRAEEVAGLANGKQELKEIDTLIERAENLLSTNDPHLRRAVFAGMRAFARAMVSAGTGGRGVK